MPSLLIPGRCGAAISRQLAPAIIQRIAFKIPMMSVKYIKLPL
jgi:hypothetical protein